MEIDVPTAQEIRDRMLQFCGQNRYSQFVASCKGVRSRGRLRFFQEILWSEFVIANSDCVLPFDQICDVFAVCHLHNCEFQTKTVPVWEGCVDFAPTFIKDRITKFPNASVEFVSSEGRIGLPAQLPIHYCEECDRIQAASRWCRKQRSPKHNRSE